MTLQFKKTLIGIGALTILLGGIKFIQIARAIAEHAKFAPPPTAVTTQKVTTTQWRETFETVGSFASMAGATLSAKESGNVVTVRFESGAKVRAGDVLLEIDSSVENANLKGALARLELARQNLQRAQALKSQSALSLSTLEDAQSKVRQCESEVQSINAAIERKTIVAPFDGRAGIRTVNVGSFVNAGAPIVPLYSMDPIYFNFSVPQQLAPKIETKSPISVTVDAFEGRVFEGEITAINPNIDEVTRAISVQATIKNQKEELRPGMFGTTQLEVGTPTSVLAIPLTSVVYAPYGLSVYVVERRKDADGNELLSARQQMVQVGSKHGDLVAVAKGLNEGDEVVTSGAFKLRPGAPVAIQSEGAPPVSSQPTVENS